MTKVRVMVGTRKGAFVLSSDASRQKWSLSEPQFLGHIIYHIVACPHDNSRMVMAAKTGHLGPTVYHSSDRGATWTESSSPPAFPKVPEGGKGKAVEIVFWISRGHQADKGRWYAGTSPAGLFVSNDDGASWEPVSGFNEHKMYSKWTESGPTPGGQLPHSVIVDPRDKNHMYFGLSVGGVFESTDGGRDWKPLNKGIAADFMPDPDVEYGHDPHCIVMHPKNPDRLYQQNHCGIYRIDRPSDNWIRIGDNMPKAVGDIGFPIVAHPRDVDTAWVFPMDGSTVWPRTSPDGKPAVYCTRDGGASWIRQDKGLPKEKAYFTVKRQAMTGDSLDKVGLYFGTSQGEVWASFDEGENWSCLVSYLPEIYSLTVVEHED